MLGRANFESTTTSHYHNVQGHTMDMCDIHKYTNFHLETVNERWVKVCVKCKLEKELHEDIAD